jgi:predicted amidohydrolase YtcJ
MNAKWRLAAIAAALGVGLLIERSSVAAEGSAPPQGAPADMVFEGGKIVTVDPMFRISQAMAVRGERILAVGTNEEIHKLIGPATRSVDLGGKTVLPGLNDSHLHPPGAAVYEFDHRVPDMESVADVFDYVKSRARAVPSGDWIVVQQVFITRLREQRFPTRQELDKAAPHNPAMFRTGPDAALNSLALKESGIDKDFEITDGLPGRIERDSTTGEPTGILRNCQRLVKSHHSERKPNKDERRQCLKALLAAYNEVGLTSISDRGVSDDTIELYQQLKDRNELSCRVFLTYFVQAQAPWEEVEAGILRAAEHPLHRYDPMLWLKGLKIFLDGGMLTGSAYMLEPWGVSKIYSITDPEYRGVRFIEPEPLYKIARLTLSHDLQLTAHTVGDGAVEGLVEAYERVDKDDFPVRDKRPCISHCNFMTAGAVERMQRLGIVADLQPAWLYLDGVTLLKHFGNERLTYFQPYKTLFEEGVMVGGGSDHMQKLGGLRSINPYNPFLGMWTTLRRLPRWTDQPLHPEQCIDRQQAIRLYTINCAVLTFQEEQKGSLEPGKLADFIVLDRDILTCPVDDVKDTQVLETWLGGRQVYRRN